MKIILYSFLGFHSFLIGLFPFYIPVFLYSNSMKLTWVCFFIALTGMGYCLTLYWLDRAMRQYSLRMLISLSFLLELLLLTSFYIEKTVLFLIVAGLLNGCFNCAFWILQRLLFFKTVDSTNSGRKFGNFQIFVLIVLKSAIFAGGIVLESFGYSSLYTLSIFIALLASIVLYRVIPSGEFLKLNQRPIDVKGIFIFSDSYRSKIIFVVDGIYLYLESYFWVISMYLLVHENFARLGALVVILTLIFGALFLLIKNTIDSLPGTFFFNITILLYGLSWVLRSTISDEYSLTTLFVTLALISFCTSLFRLAFNKRFFDLAGMLGNSRYIVLKSYYSQFFLIVFAAVAYLLDITSLKTVQQLSYLYMGAALGSCVYFFYAKGRNDENQSSVMPIN